jgi:hypothetical protein
MELRPINNVSISGPKPSPVNDLGQPTEKQIQEDQSHQGESPESTMSAHARTDVDSSQKALHHSLGTSRNQASPGNHIHDGIGSPKLGAKKFDTTAGQEGKVIPSLSISGSRGGNAAVASMIALLKNFVDFTDNTTA